LISPFSLINVKGNGKIHTENVVFPLFSFFDNLEDLKSACNKTTNSKYNNFKNEKKLPNENAVEYWNGIILHSTSSSSISFSYLDLSNVKTYTNTYAQEIHIFSFFTVYGSGSLSLKYCRFRNVIEDSFLPDTYSVIRILNFTFIPLNVNDGSSVGNKFSQFTSTLKNEEEYDAAANTTTTTTHLIISECSFSNISLYYVSGIFLINSPQQPSSISYSSQIVPSSYLKISFINCDFENISSSCEGSCISLFCSPLENISFQYFCVLVILDCSFFNCIGEVEGIN
jgi:hypothetical protein